MTSEAFKKALSATDFLRVNGDAAAGLTQAGQDTGGRLRPVLSDNRIGLNADAVFLSHGSPAAIFKDAGETPPSAEKLAHWHEAAWNVGIAPLLWIVTPTDVHLYDCYASPLRESSDQTATKPLDTFALNVENQLQKLNSMCGRHATETGAFWSSSIGNRIDRRHRVDRELLDEIKELESRLVQVPPAHAAPSLDDNEEQLASREFAQRLIGRCIFTSYLVDRGIAQPFLPESIPHRVEDMLASVESTFRLFKWLRATFNGDLFPMDDPGAEHDRLGTGHLALLRDFVESRSLLSGQGRLFRFRFDAIPIDLISSIYQQFARSGAAEKAHAQGLHYTPFELVHLTLDPVFEGLSATARVIDPTCGSGAFLVEAFRRLVWKRSEGQPANRSIVRDVLYNQLYGLDINKSALGVAAFSLYLAALELDEDPVSDISDLKFDRLIGETLFQADTVGDELPCPITLRPFDAVVGNPPWTFTTKTKSKRKRSKKDDAPTAPRRSPDQEFLWIAIRLAGEAGRIGMIMKATPFFVRDPIAVKAREGILRKLKPAALVNLSALRKDDLFPDATGPALLVFGRCTLMDQRDGLLVGSIPWTPNFKRNGVFHVGPGELRSLSLDRVLRTPPMLKAATFGTARDGWLIEKLERSLPTLRTVLDNAGLKSRGQGFQVRGKDAKASPKHYFKLPVLSPDRYTPFRVEADLLPRFEHPTLHRTRDAAIFKGPLLLCPEGAFLRTTGRYSATVSRVDALFVESFFGVSFPDEALEKARLLCAIFCSSITTFQLAYGGGAWGLERTKVKPNEVLALRIPDLNSIDADTRRNVLEAERYLAMNPECASAFEDLDRTVYDLYDLDRDEALLVGDSVRRSRMLLFESRKERLKFTRIPSAETMENYAGAVVRTVNGFLRARGQRHLEAVIFPRHTASNRSIDDQPGTTAVKFGMAPGAPTDIPAVRHGNSRDAEVISEAIKRQANPDIPPYLAESRQLRIYSENDLFVTKPAEVRYWTPTAGLNDADAILADHWIKGRHAAEN